MSRCDPAGPTSDQLSVTQVTVVRTRARQLWSFLAGKSCFPPPAPEEGMKRLHVTCVGIEALCENT